MASRPTIPKLLLAGKKGSGKTKATTYIKSKVPDAVSFTFAKPIKDTCKAVFLLSDEQLNDEKLKEEVDPRWNYSPRQLMQRIGDLLRDDLPKALPNLKIDQGSIVNQNMYYRIQEHELGPKPPLLEIIEDGRYSIENAFFKRLSSPNLSVRLLRGAESTDTHSSEQIDFHTDATIDNNRSLEMLYNELDNIVEHLMAAKNNHSR